MSEELLIGLVSISDRASSGVYEDKGIPALRSGSAPRWPRPGAWRRA
jgi:molybdopterin adenylyltransferase